jgi:anti-repressor protein
MNELQVFQNNQFGQVRVIEKDGEPWFVAKDVCTILGLEQVSRAMDRLDEDERGLLKVTHPQSPEKQLEVNGVNESGLYQLIIASNKSEAKAFKRWITHEVIPTIRKHGAYMTPDTIEKVLADPDTIIQLATRLKEEQQKRILAENKIEQDKPKVLFADAVEVSKTSILIGDLAKLIKQNGCDTGQKRLFEWMRSNGYLMKNGVSRNMPTQKAMELGLFEVKESTINNPDGSVRITRTTKVTGKGQVYFVNKFLEAVVKDVG